MRLKLLVIGFSSLFLISCTNYFKANTFSSLTTISGVIQLGPVNGSAVKAYCLDASGQRAADPIGLATSDSNGKFSIALSEHTNCSILISASGGSYTEESTGATVQMSATDEIRSFLEMAQTEDSSVSVSITPISEMAVSRFESLRDSLESSIGPTDDHERLDLIIKRAKEEIRETVGLPSEIDITNILPSRPDAPDNDPNSARNQLALVLAGVSQMAAAKGKNSLELTTLLASDASDGSIADESWLDLPTHIQTWTNGVYNSGGFVAAPVVTPVLLPSVDMDDFPLPGGDAIDAIRVTPFRLFISPTAAQASSLCAGPFEVQLISKTNERTPAENGLQLQLLAQSQVPQNLKLFSSLSSCESGSGEVTLQSVAAGDSDLSSLYVAFGSSRPEKILLRAIPVASSVLPTEFTYVVPTAPPAPPAALPGNSTGTPVGSSQITCTGAFASGGSIVSGSSVLSLNACAAYCNVIANNNPNSQFSCLANSQLLVGSYQTPRVQTVAPDLAIACVARVTKPSGVFDYLPPGAHTTESCKSYCDSVSILEGESKQCVSYGSVFYSYTSEPPTPEPALEAAVSLWEPLDFVGNGSVHCEGPRFVGFSSKYNLYVGAELCGSNESYKLFLSPLKNGTYYQIADFAGHGQDHCELVNPDFTIPNEDDINSGTCTNCAVENLIDVENELVFARSNFGETFQLVQSRSWADLTTSSYQCGVTVEP